MSKCFNELRLIFCFLMKSNFHFQIYDLSFIQNEYLINFSCRWLFYGGIEIFLFFHFFLEKKEALKPSFVWERTTVYKVDVVLL